MKVMDYTTERKQEIEVSVTYHSVVDLLLALWVHANAECGEPISDLDIDATFFEDVFANLSPESEKALENMPSGETWIALLSLVPLAGEGGSVQDFIDFLATHDAVDLRSRLIWLYQEVDEPKARLAADAAAGKPGAVDVLLDLESYSNPKTKLWRETLRFILGLEPEESRQLLVDVLADVQASGFHPYEKDFREYLETDFKAKASMGKRLCAERLIEIATNGISVAEKHLDTPVMLMPTVVARPWVVLAESPHLFIMGYPVSDRTLASDPEAPPLWLVKLHKALGDERRLKILRRLAQGDASLAELSTEVDIAKSTLHHHMMLLRAAGLIKVHVGQDKLYSLRDETLPEAATYLNHYIHKTAEPREEMP